VLFIDFNSKIIYFYDSIGNHNLVCNRFVEIFKNIANLNCGLEFKFVNNQAQQQFHNKLCGLYVVDFTMQMLTCKSNRELYFHKTFNIIQRNDELININQNKYIYPDSTQKTNALSRFFRLKNLFGKMFPDLFYI
jgi:hypothetical protein